MSEFSFIILTYNEEQHLPRLLQSIEELHAPIYILDSGSTDKTFEICRKHNAIIHIHAFENHPRQWNVALNYFQITTPWIIALDADQIVTKELLMQLKQFKDIEYKNINAIYFNRKNFFKGKWIKFGGYYPKYLLKMFRTGIGYSDLNENMDHRFIVPGKTIVWDKGHIVEENLKENNISFWIQKHDKYSSLVAEEEVQRSILNRKQTNKLKFFGNPDERIAYLKNKWWQLPLIIRPFLYFIYRYIFQLGFLDGKFGFIFHFLQGFWFRLIVDIKIEELKKVHKNT
jgi:glycosyltransferase involved in cell wall biosynthesis